MDVTDMADPDDDDGDGDGVYVEMMDVGTSTLEEPLNIIEVHIVEVSIFFSFILEASGGQAVSYFLTSDHEALSSNPARKEFFS